MHPSVLHTILAAVLSAVIFFPSISMARELPIVFEDYPPYEYIEDGEVKGINMDLIREAFRRMGMKPFFEPRPWKRAILELKTGEILALSSGFKTRERLEFAFFPSEGLGVEVNMIVVRADSDLEVNSLDDLRTIRLGVTGGYAYDAEFDAMTGLHKIEASSTHHLVKMLLNKRVDAIIGNIAVIRHIAKQNGDLDQIKLIYKVSEEPLYLFFSRVRGEEVKKISDTFGETIRQMKADGTFEKIQAKY